MIQLVRISSLTWLLHKFLAVDDCAEQTKCLDSFCESNATWAQLNCQITCGYCTMSCLCAQVDGNLSGWYEWNATTVGWVDGSVVMKYWEQNISPELDWVFVFLDTSINQISWYKEVDVSEGISMPVDGEFFSIDSNSNIKVTASCMECPTANIPTIVANYRSATIIVITLIGLCLLAIFLYFKCLRRRNELKFHQIEIGNNTGNVSWTKGGDRDSRISSEDEDVNYHSNVGRRCSLADRKREEIRKYIEGTWTMGSRSYQVSSDGMGDYKILQEGNFDLTKASITMDGRFSIEDGNYTAYYSNNKLIWSDGDTWVKRCYETIPESDSGSSNEGSTYSDAAEYALKCTVTKPNGSNIEILETVSSSTLVAQLQRQLASKLRGVTKNQLLIYRRRFDDVPISSEWRLKDANIRNDEVFVVVTRKSILHDELQEAWEAVP